MQNQIGSGELERMAAELLKLYPSLGSYLRMGPVIELCLELDAANKIRSALVRETLDKYRWHWLADDGPPPAAGRYETATMVEGRLPVIEHQNYIATRWIGGAFQAEPDAWREIPELGKSARTVENRLAVALDALQELVGGTLGPVESLKQRAVEVLVDEGRMRRVRDGVYNVATSRFRVAISKSRVDGGGDGHGRHGRGRSAGAAGGECDGDSREVNVTTGFYCEDEIGQVVRIDDLLIWAEWMETHGDRRRVALSELGERGTVSTVFLGLDHQFGEGPPILYETLVFGGPWDGVMYRYSTRELALRGHEGVVNQVQPGFPGLSLDEEE